MMAIAWSLEVENDVLAAIDQFKDTIDSDHVSYALHRMSKHGNRQAGEMLEAVDMIECRGLPVRM